MTIKTYEERLKEQQESESRRAELNSQLNTSAANFDTQKKQVNENYNKKIDDTADSYEDLYRENAVQKIVNERAVAENMANLGLTDSGLNRTQQTAVQLSYANNKAKFDVSRQKAVDSLALQLANEISQIDINKATAEQSIRDTWNKENVAYATELYNTDVENETARYKAEQEQIAATNKAYYSALSKQAEAQAEIDKENSYIIKANNANLSYGFKGSLKDNGVTVRYNDDGTTTYVDINSQKSVTMPSTKNPYTGKTHDDVVYGTFSNGYQPNNIGGNKLHKEKGGATATVKGRKQSIWTYNDKDFYIWNGKIGDYVELNDKEKEKFGIK